LSLGFQAVYMYSRSV